MSTAFDKIASGLADAIAYADGDETKARVAAGPDVKAIRAKTKLSQAKFAEKLRVPVATVLNGSSTGACRMRPRGLCRGWSREYDKKAIIKVSAESPVLYSDKHDGDYPSSSASSSEKTFGRCVPIIAMKLIVISASTLSIGHNDTPVRNGLTSAS
jgi:hypothetical protein